MTNIYIVYYDLFKNIVYLPLTTSRNKCVSISSTEMPLPVNGDRKSTDDDGKLELHTSGRPDANGIGGDLRRAATTLESSWETTNAQVVDRRQNDVPDGIG